ncbi:DEAD/DEAH box helicase [Mucilaginibacter gilvus]|uniref:DEAD/DEAH box helicase n=1 Tax=Mucilaginibacter gilvus TaxID=2305909 RepID=A0A444MJ81_9SPHI|nr:DEAD/DEAH box helicase [Mucilaginibacter gilvus]RWY48174.1 DEAD/DEAH box helicase [Mucilaginibacter gilvus]
MPDFEETLINLDSLTSLNFDESFGAAQLCSSLLKRDDGKARIIIINALNNWAKFHPATTEMWTDLVEAAGFYPYLEKNRDWITINNLPGEIRKEVHSSSNLASKYFHEKQYELLKLLEDGKNVIVSAPTSFGKSLLIEEIIAAKRFKNIVIIQPTLALLDETRKKLLKYKEFYKLIVRTSQEPSPTLGNVFLFTAERVNEYPLFPKIEFIVIDEFYKLSGNRDDERSSSLNCALYYLLKTFSPQFYLLGPNIDAISSGFVERFNAVFFKSDYSLVDSKSVDVYKTYSEEFNSKGKVKNKEKRLFELLLKLKNEQSIIYCSSPNRVRNLSKSFVEFLKENNDTPTVKNYPLIQWVQNNVSRSWSLLDNLNYDIGIHDGALQKHICTSIIDYFNSGDLKFLFCTSTIIEGVNTSAKNIIYFDETKGGNPIDFFDYSNIKGRAGRMMEHYVGTIYNFNKPPVNNTILIDIPFFVQEPIRDELLIQIDHEEVLNKETKQYIDIQNIPPGDKEVIKKNGAKVDGQKSIFEILRQDIKTKYPLINWTVPDYEQLRYILELAWDHLLIEGETTSPMTKAKLVNRTFNYGLEKNINSLITSDFNYKRGQLKPASKKTPNAPRVPKYENLSDSELMNECIQEIFQMMKHWFEYKVPKWLSVINEIQKFICSEEGLMPGNYRIYANMIENDFLRDNLSILGEYGVPSSAIRKLERLIPRDIHEDDVINYIKNNNLNNLQSLILYEQYKLRDL